MDLTPARYECAEHNQDLTEAVREQLEDRVPAAFAQRKPRPFAVIVTCPGGGTRHRLRFDGEIVSSDR